MKQLLYCFLAAGSFSVVRAQTPITITAAQYPATATSVDRLQPAALPGIAAPATGANQAWDYRSLTRSGSEATRTYAAVSGTPPFAGSIRSYNFSNPLGPFTVAATAYEGFDAQGFSQLGSVVPAQTFPLVTITGGPNDVLAVPAQSIAVNGLHVPLPLTTTTRVVRTSRIVNNSLLTLQVLGYSQAPFRYVQRVTTVDSVAGWGTVRIPITSSAAGSAPIPVLLMRTRYIEQDSFYLNNQPAPAFLLTALGQTQGASQYAFLQEFYRQNAAQPVMRFVYATSTLTAPTAVYYSSETTVPLAVTAAAAVAAGGLTTWPNPGAQGQARAFALAGAAPGQPLRLTLRDATGRAVAAAAVPNGQPATLPALPPGLYLAEVEAADGTRASRRLVVE